MNTPKIDAAKHFGLHKSLIRLSALRLALGEAQKREEFIDWRKLDRILDKWRLRDAFAFYSARPEMF
jgi:hypothetical protein